MGVPNSRADIPVEINLHPKMGYADAGTIVVIRLGRALRWLGDEGPGFVTGTGRDPENLVGGPTRTRTWNQSIMSALL